MKHDAWKLYCEAFRVLFPSPSVKPDGDIVSPAALQEMVDRLLSVRPEVARSGETPRTDALMDPTSPVGFKGQAMVDLARQLERELAQAKADLAEVDEANTRLAREKQAFPSPLAGKS